MPNWCSNTINVIGDGNELRDFLYWVTVDGDGEPHFDITKLRPTPEALVNTKSGWYSDETEQKNLEKKQEENIATYGHKDWYDWNITNWGTKWSPSEVGSLFISRNLAEFYYDTAWSPCSTLWEYISTLYPTLAFIETFEEMGAGFYGVTGHYRGGQFFESFVDTANSEDDKWNEIFEKMSNDDTGDSIIDMEEYTQEQVGKMLEEALLSLPAPVKLARQAQTQ